MGTTGPRSRWFTAAGRRPAMPPQPDGWTMCPAGPC